MKKTIITLSMLAIMAGATAGNKQEIEVVFKSNIKCENCKNKIMKNIAFEKGVKALDVDIEKKTVTIKYRKDKNTTASLNKALDDLGYKSEVMVEKEVAKEKK